MKKEFLGKTKKELASKRNTFESHLENGLSFEEASALLKKPSHPVLTPPKTREERLLGETLRSWLFDVKRVSDNVKASSFSRYEGLYRLYVKDRPIALLPIKTIASNDLQRHYNHLYEKEGKTYGVLKELNKLLKAFFNYEIAQERLCINPCSSKKIAIPGASTQKKRTEIMSADELKQFIQALDGKRLEMLFLFGIGTGMRIGELLALKLQNLDVEGKSVDVVATLYECNVFDADGNKTFETMRNSTKNRQCRTVPIPSNLIPKLKSYLLARKKYKLKLGRAFEDASYVFPNAVGGPLSYSNVRKQYLKIFEETGLPYRRIHSLRHSYASMLNENGASIVNIQELLGHSDTKTTEIYIHTSDASKRRDVDTLSIL